MQNPKNKAKVDIGKEVVVTDVKKSIKTKKKIRKAKNLSLQS